MRNFFKLTLGDASLFVGLQIERDRENKVMRIHQRAYARRIIERFGMECASAVSVPADPHVILYPVNENEKGNTTVPYREAVGSLMFLAIVSRPDISYAVNNASKYLNNHNDTHWQAVKRIFKYLVGTTEIGIIYRGNGDGNELIGYSDADYASDMETRRSTTGYAFCLANGVVTWASQRQKLVSLSTTESEYIAAAAAAKEASWLRNLLQDIERGDEKPTRLLVDNQSAIKLVKNPEFHKRTKHIDIRHHFIRERVTDGDIEVIYVPTEGQLADIFTKALPRDRLAKLRANLGMSESF